LILPAKEIWALAASVFDQTATGDDAEEMGAEMLIGKL
jgi:hypothetical protein